MKRTPIADSEWYKSWAELRIPAPAAIFRELKSRYLETHRAYHTLQHIEECFAALGPARDLAEDPVALALALWFHDAVYDTHRRDNERASAELARERIGPVVGEAHAGRVYDLIMATKHDAVPDGRDERLIEDIDLAILAAPSERFREYEKQIRMEYSWMPEDVFQRERVAILERFLARPRIYTTPWFAERYEAPARANLSASLRSPGPARD